MLVSYVSGAFKFQDSAQDGSASSSTAAKSSVFNIYIYIYMQKAMIMIRNPEMEKNTFFCYERA